MQLLRGLDSLYYDFFHCLEIKNNDREGRKCTYLILRFFYFFKLSQGALLFQVRVRFLFFKLFSKCIFLLQSAMCVGVSSRRKWFPDQNRWHAGRVSFKWQSVDVERFQQQLP